MYAKNVIAMEPKIGRPGFRVVKRKKLGVILAEKRHYSIEFKIIKKRIAAEFDLDNQVGAVTKIEEVRKRIKQMLED